MVFKINLATRVYINSRLLTLCTAAAVVLLLALLAVNCATIAKDAAEIETLTGQIRAMDEKIKAAGGSVSERQYGDLVARVGFANAVIEKKGYNWLELLDKLELVVPDGVAVSSIAPDPRSGALKLTGTARVFGNIRSLMERMEASTYFTDVYLVSQAEATLADKSPAINFAITCKVGMK